jgi:peptide/nickel transport system permease protein
MGTYIVRRILQAILILFGLSIVFFLILHLTPGGPCQAFEGQGFAAAAKEQACTHRLGLDQPFVVQYFKLMGTYSHGDLGTSIWGTPVNSEVTASLPATILLIGSSYLIQQMIALPLGVFAALRQYTFFDQLFTFVSYVGLAMPTFWLGLLLVFTFAVHFQWFPPGRVEDLTMPLFWTGPWFDLLRHDPGLVLGDLVRHLTLPMVTLIVVGIAVDSRFMRSSMLEVIRQDYIRTAKAKGLAPRVVIFKHAFRNALLPIITNVGLYLPALLGGAVITETIFTWNGLGYLYIHSINVNDYPTIQALSMIGALAVLMSNLLTDLTYAWVDPRIRYD